MILDQPRGELREVLGHFLGAWVAEIAVAGHQVALLDPTREDLIFKTASYLWLQLNRKSLPFLPLTIRHVETARNLFFFPTLANLWRRESPLIRAVYNLLREAERRAQSVWSLSPTWSIGKAHFIEGNSQQPCRIHCTKPCCWSIGGFCFAASFVCFQLESQIALK